MKKDNIILLLLAISILLGILNDVMQDRQIKQLEDVVESMNEQICYIESEIE